MTRKEVTRKNKTAARLWPQRWDFYTRLREVQEEEALKKGIKTKPDANNAKNCNVRAEN